MGNIIRLNQARKLRRDQRQRARENKINAALQRASIPVLKNTVGCSVYNPLFIQKSLASRQSRQPHPHPPPNLPIYHSCKSES